MGHSVSHERGDLSTASGLDSHGGVLCDWLGAAAAPHARRFGVCDSGSTPVLLDGRSFYRTPLRPGALAQAIAEAAQHRLRWPWLFVAIYSFLPVPSDPVFVAIGTGVLPQRSSTVAYFLARSVFNTLMV